VYSSDHFGRGRSLYTITGGSFFKNNNKNRRVPLSVKSVWPEYKVYALRISGEALNK
jgi:hypothetical protein